LSERVCGCGFVAAGPGELTDHLFEVFLPDGDVGPDGDVHAEDAHDNRACRCGFTGQDTAALDEHLLAIFTPADGIGRDGQSHDRQGHDGGIAE
jgi:hypothetical protein